MRVDQLKAKPITSHTVEMGTGTEESVHNTPRSHTEYLLHRAPGQETRHWWLTRIKSQESHWEKRGQANSPHGLLQCEASL